jgi:hypothetical protein
MVEFSEIKSRLSVEQAKVLDRIDFLLSGINIPVGGIMSKENPLYNVNQQYLEMKNIIDKIILKMLQKRDHVPKEDDEDMGKIERKAMALTQALISFNKKTTIN